MVTKVYSAEFRADAVALHLSDPKSTYEGVAKDPETAWATNRELMAQLTGTFRRHH
ncbi:hypothetical protein GCM10027073_63010 [Streptomyces chlorus]|uniref:Uncharacterized protein n=1 Tax=Streptomyces chlorus TaxID=887452 RepID=A0ABW1E9G6_9ACTN